MMKSKRLRRRGLFLPVFLIAALLLGFLFLKGVIKINTPSEEKYPVRGVDVSHYQGEIDFNALAGQGMRFAFIKATEGSTYVDDHLDENLPAVQESSLRPGFYHFFSYDSPGSSQAAHFIENVPALEGMLPPVIDVEFYGSYFSSPASAEAVLPELRAMADALREHYGVPPIIYCTQKAWRLYVRDNFDDCDLWIRDVYLWPRADQDWTFWQFTDSARLGGYSGDEPCIDVNVFAGTAEEFDLYGKAVDF